LADHGGGEGWVVLAELTSNAGQYLHGSPSLAVLAVFVGGMLTASNPCVLAMIPLMMGFVAGHRDGKPGVLRAFGLSLVFVLGLGITFTVLGGDRSAGWPHLRRRLGDLELGGGCGLCGHGPASGRRAQGADAVAHGTGAAAHARRSWCPGAAKVSKPTPEESAQCCAKSSRLVAGCHD
jgi:hypothetical protein